ncbi:M23 family metallopeptidase [Rhizobium sp. KVB221]|uniref:M23 family metallopeptidase n=1 Tax=Rhizobium setariae TaxID=2801340 RepID=A0A937CMZ4_9HYPH|nr:M23 family metallopeptidase [Rhizobium setariae]MBL0374900.1 M23 family metallopeptidase [Rhizobium setariae]
MTDAKIIRSIGDEPPILAEGRRTPDRREVSLRWLSGTFLTGLTSSILMGVALFAALEGRELLAIPAEASTMTRLGSDPKEGAATFAQKGKRLIAATIAAKPADKSVMDVPTVVIEGEKQVIRKRPFAHVKMALAASYPLEESYPRFDPLNMVSSGEKAVAAAPSPVFYGSDVESEVALKTSDFPAGTSHFPLAASMSLDEVEENVRTNGSVLTAGDAQVSTLYYVDPQRFASDSDTLDMINRLSARVVEENTTVAIPTAITEATPEYADDIIPVRANAKLGAVLLGAGYAKAEAQDIEDFISTILQRRELSEGEVLRIGIIQEGEKARVVRVSLYKRGTHQLTVAIDDKGKFVTGAEPPYLAAIATAFDDNPTVVADSRDLPRVYDGIYRAALSYGMSKDMTARMIRLLASSVDFQARLKPSDQLEAFYSVEDETGEATDESELLYIHAKFGDTDTRLYRFQDPDDMSIDYYDQDGKSLKQFLIRNPLPNGSFRSGFGMRRHPILGYMRMHTGVDWSAPRGTPIIAAGNGTVIKAGWDRGGYGNQTLIQHPNGYVTSYNHQSAIAKGVKEGAKVVQGQVIGWVGTTGQSTGPHLHYEVIVNGNKVDPQRIRLPGGNSLRGADLAKFEQERKRIDDLLNKGESKQVASQ